MQLTAQKDSPETAVRPRRSVRLRLLATGLLILLLVIALFCWRPWQQRIHIVTSSNPKDGASMVWVPAGNFRMGDAISSEDIRTAFREDGWQGGLDMLIKFMRGKPYSYNAPLHTVYLDGYWIYTYEVTVAQYRRFCMATKRDMKPAPGGAGKIHNPLHIYPGTRSAHTRNGQAQHYPARRNGRKQHAARICGSIPGATSGTIQSAAIVVVKLHW